MAVNNDNTESKTLVEGFLACVQQYPDNRALEVAGKSFCYAELCEKAALLSSILNRQDTEKDSGAYAAILCKRHAFAFQAILASLFSARAYVPFDSLMPESRIVDLLRALDCRVLFVDSWFYSKLAPLLNRTDLSPCLIIHEDELVIHADSRHEYLCMAGFATEQEEKKRAIHDAISASSLSMDTLMSITKGRAVDQSEKAYVLFTSGSTGLPKAVPISHENICSYLAEMQNLYPIFPTDRCSQAFELSFDPSVHDMFMSWFSGACLCVMDERARLGAHYFIKRHGITVWNTIPSLVKLCLAMRSFNQDYLFPLRRVFFNGEPLQVSVVEALQAHIPEAGLVNLYGLTETTVNFAHYLWQGENTQGRDLVAIGKVFPSIEVFEGDAEEREGKNVFELMVAGPQVFAAYLELDESLKAKNRQVFVAHGGKRFFRTGDLVYQDEQGLKHIIGRRDEQIKLMGKRVDLDVIRQRLEQVSACLDALVLSVIDEYGDVSLVGFLQGQIDADEKPDMESMRAHVNQELPAHMHLHRLLLLDVYPYLASGKVDKGALRALVKV